MPSIKSLLRLTRAHTAPLEIIPAVVGATLAIGEFWSIDVLIWGVFGLAYHLTGYGQNSLVDYKNGYDKDDPNKSHHPLNTGELSVSTASHAVTLLIIYTIIYLIAAIFLTASSFYAVLIALAVSILMVYAGMEYNYEGKTTILKPVPISIAHTCVFVLPYVTMAEPILTSELIGGTLVVSLWVFFQIGISGEIKDLEQEDETNILRETFGLYVEDGLILSKSKHGDMNFLASCYVIRGLMYIFWAFLLYPDVKYLAFGVVALYIIDFATTTSLAWQSYNRENKLRLMAGIEIMSLSLLSLSAYPVNIYAAPALILGALLWVFVLNYIEWGTILAPDV